MIAFIEPAKITLVVEDSKNFSISTYHFFQTNRYSIENFFREIESNHIMDRYQLKVFVAAFIIHILCTVLIPFAIYAEWEVGDYYLFCDFAQIFLTDPTQLYQPRPLGFMWLPAYILLYLLFNLLYNGTIYMVLQIAIFAPCLYYFGNFLAGKKLPKMWFALLLILFASMWTYTYNYRVANDKIFLLFFLLLGLWAAETKKHPAIVAFGLTMVVSRFIYFAPILLYWILEEFQWKKVLWTAVVFVALNCAFLIYPFLIFDFLEYNLSLVQNPAFISIESFNMPWGLFTYLRGTLFSGQGIIIFGIGLGAMLVGSLWLYLRKFPFQRFCTYYSLLVLMFFPLNEWQHPTFLVPVCLLFYVQSYPMRTRDEQNKQTFTILMEWAPLACFLFMAFPIPYDLVAILPLPTFIYQFRIILFIVLFFILTLKKGLFSPPPARPPLPQ